MSVRAGGKHPFGGLHSFKKHVSLLYCLRDREAFAAIALSSEETYKQRA
jgi:hypothetical protein